jgi:hypothetical protein
MTVLLEKALEKLETLPRDEQDAYASEILETLADDQDWRARFASKRDRLRQLANEALEEDARGETRSLDELFDRI